ncbi:MAG: nitrate/nitrite transporter [Coriobacteriales bacterium]
MKDQKDVDIALQDKAPAKAWAVLAVTYLASVCAPLCQFKIPPLASWLFPAFHGQLDAVSFGTLMSAIAIIGVILAFPAAFIARKIGLKNVILLSVACLGVGSALGGFATSLNVLMVSRLLEGVGIGLIGVAAPSCVTIWFPRKTRGVALGIWATWVPVGSVLSFNVVPPLAIAGGYQLPFFVIAGVCLLAFILFAAVFTMPQGASADMGLEGSFKESFKYLKNRRIWILGAVFFLFSFATIGIMNTYYNTFLETQLGMEPQRAAFLSSLIMAISIVAAPVTGRISDKVPIGRKYIVGIVMMVILLPTAFFMFNTGGGALAIMWVVIILQGVGGGMCGGSLRPMAPIIMPQTAMGATMGMAIMQFCQNMGSAVGSPLSGAVMSTFGWDMASLMLQLPAYALGLVLIFFIMPRGKNVTLADVQADISQ